MKQGYSYAFCKILYLISLTNIVTISSFPSNWKIYNNEDLGPLKLVKARPVLIGLNFKNDPFSTLCPHNDFLEQRYDSETDECYIVGTSGPCGVNMIFKSIENNKTHGICDCNYQRNDRPLLHFGNSCHFLYTQAFCEQGQWLSLDMNFEAVCMSNPCMKKALRSNLEDGHVPLDGKCVKLGSASKYCDKGEVVSFSPSSLFPTCTKSIEQKKTRRRVSRQITRMNKFKCQKGQRRTGSGCRQIIKVRL